MDKRPKIYGKFKDGAVVELADIKESGKGFNDYPPFYIQGLKAGGKKSKAQKGVL